MDAGASDPGLVPAEPDIDESGVDRAQIRAMLALTPAERLARVAEFTSGLIALRAGDRPGDAETGSR